MKIRHIPTVLAFALLGILTALAVWCKSEERLQRAGGTNFFSNLSMDEALMRNKDRLKDTSIADLSHTDVSDVGLSCLAGCPDLQVLHLGHTKVTDGGMAVVGKITSLRVLVLCDTLVTDAGLARLERLENLESLCLSGTRVSDASIPVLSGMKSLQVLHLRKTLVTTDGAARLREALPDCDIVVADK